MKEFIKAVSSATILLLILFAMVRTSGWALIPFAFLFAILLSYVGYSVVRGKETPYPRIATGVFERSDDADIKLSQTDSCEACTDDDGEGIRKTKTTEIVFLGVPIAVTEKETEVLCTACANPLDAFESGDSIDRELAKEAETE